MSSVRTVRSAPVYTPPKPKETEPNAPVAKQGAPMPEASAKKPEPKQKPGHGKDSSTASVSPKDPNVVPRVHLKEPKTKQEAVLRTDEVLTRRGGSNFHRQR